MEKNPAIQAEVTILSAEDLRINGRSIKNNALVTIRTDSSTDLASTTINTEGGSYPSWNEKLHLSLSHDSKFITIVVQRKTGSLARIIGTANIPVSDFMGGHFPQNYLHFLSYRLRENNGERNGVINVSVQVRGGDFVPQPKMFKSGAQTDYGSSSYGVKSMYPMLPSLGTHRVGADNSSGGVAMGIPVSYDCSVHRHPRGWIK